MYDFSRHFLLDEQAVIVYLQDYLQLLPAENKIEAEEIGDGNINYVFRVKDATTGKTLIVKQADTLLRSSGRPLDTTHNQIEAEMLKIQGLLVPGLVPALFYYDEQMFALVMEDISAYGNLRKALATGKIFPNLAEDMTTFLVEMLLSTTDLCWDRHDKKRKVQTFINIDLCDISEDLVFTEPYNNYQHRNQILSENQQFVQEKIFQNVVLIGEVADLRNKFMNNAQSLLHGDLHTGSIFINEKGLKVIDPEFAFYGPMGYDVGNVLGNLCFAWINHAFTDSQNEPFLTWIQTTIKQIFDLFQSKFENKYREDVVLDLYQNKNFKAQYLNEILADSVGYMGTEIIRRVVGDTKVSEITEVTDNNLRVPMERALLEIGIRCVINRHSYRNGQSLVDDLQKVVTIYQQREG